MVNLVMKDNERNDMVEQDNEMDSQVEKDQVDDGDVKEIEGGGDGKPPSKLDYQYSRDELMKYMNHPLAHLRPVIKDPNIYSLLCWSKPQGWTYVKRSDTPNDRGDDSFKRRPNDPRERVRKEQDGIVLSPQRRSFNSGCFVTVSPNGPNRSESAKDGPVRRIGSGRIINRDWEYRDKENADDGYPYRPSVGPSPRERDDRFDIRRNYPGMSTDRELARDVSRESLSRDKDPRVRDRDRLVARYSVERRRFETEEPEWFSGPPSPPMYGYCEIPVPPVVRRGPNFHVLRTVAWSPLQLPLPRPFRPPRLCVPYVKTFGGPTSQHDTIELRGFEDNEGGPRNKAKQSSKASSKANSKDSKSSTGSRKSSAEEISSSKKGSKGAQKEVKPEPPAASSSPKAESLEKQKAEPNNAAAKEEVGRTDSHDFLNLEDFLQLDNLPLLTNGGGGESNQSSSRFSQWFRRDSPSEVIENRRSSIQDELIKNILNDINKPSVSIPMAKETDSSYFAPISPAGSTSTGSALLELLQNNSHNQSEQAPVKAAPTIKELEATGKVTSVEELEARMRQGVGQSPGSQSSQNHSKKGTSGRKEEELIAFKKLLKQVAEGGVTTATDPMNRSPASCLYQMLNKPPEPSDMMGQAHPQQGTAAQMHVPQDLVYKLLHVQEQQRQQQEFNKLLLSSGRLGPPHVSNALSPLSSELQMKVANSQPSAELLSRPEAQAILQGLRQGEITPQHLIQQLQNPAMQPRHREVLASILKLHGNSARPASPLMVPPDQALLQQLMIQQQLRNQNPLHNAVWHTSVITPNPLGAGLITLTLHHSGIAHRVPSPRELMLHTQTIMQSALIKKKLEEQRENFRKRQELQRATSPNLASAKSPNPATTPTNNFSLTNLINNNNINNNKIASVNNNNSSVASNNNLNASPAAATTTTTTRGGGGGGANSSATKSPTQLAFTPTSVLRKMTAEQQPPVKEPDGNKMNKYNEFLQAKFQSQTPSELFKMHAAATAAAQAQSSRYLANNQMLGLRNPQQQQHQQQPQQQQWNFQKPATLQQQLAQPLQQGRAIVKGNGNYAPAQSVGAGLIDIALGNNTRPVFPQRSKLTMPTTPLVQPNVFSNFQRPVTRVPPSNAGLAQQLGSLIQPQSQPSNQYLSDVSLNATLQQLLLSPSLTQPVNNYQTGGNRNSFNQFLAGNSGEGDLSTSPTSSNQLAHWFTPELLAQAQAQTRSGKTDSLNMVSVEELERLQQSSAPVIN